MLRFGALFIVGVLIATTGSLEACGQSPSGWVDQTGSSGFHVKTPPGWKVEYSPDAHVLIKDAKGSLFILVQPFKSGSAVTASKTIGPLVDHWPQIFPNPQISLLKQISDTPDQVVAKVQFGPDGGSRANVLCYNQNGAGMFYAISAPTSQFEASRATLIKVLNSFHYGEAPAPTSGGLSYTSWTEPTEQAFTVQIPQGWSASGGITRASPIDIKAEVTATSPDGQIQAQYGSGKMLPFKPLTGTIFAKGFHQGSISEYHGWFMFLDYETGDQFSKGYLNTVLSKRYTGLKIGESRDLPELQQTMESFFANSPIPVRVSVGETDFTYDNNGQTVDGACFATTIFSNPGTVSQGWIAVPGICTAPANKMPIALQVLAHLASPKWSQTWANKLNTQAADYIKVIQATAQNDRAVSDRIYDSFIKQLQGSNRQLDNLLTGMTDVKDANGNVYHVAAGKNFYYANGGTAAGSDQQNVGFTPLTQF